ncbi:MAG: hypothetical protein JHC12_04320 [Thermogladius sp.]|jgi:hypothetical protein|nr:hypothetical protein [Thermogladius sp.]
MYHVSLDTRVEGEEAARLSEALSKILGGPLFEEGGLRLFRRGDVIVLFIVRGGFVYIDILGPERGVDEVLLGLRDYLPTSRVYVRGIERFED